MKKTLLAAIAAVAVMTIAPAGAADLRPAYKGAAPASYQPRCAHFGGWYVGANLGWASLQNEWTDRDAWVDNFSTDWALGTAKTTKGGVAVGGQGGYNWQRNCTVFGIEVDGSWTDVDSTKFNTPTAGLGTKLTLNTKMDWVSTIRTRTGIVVDDVLLYVTGGFAFANIKQSWTVVDTNNNNLTESFSSDKNRWGGVFGVGAEWAWTANWSLRTEALYMIFKEETVTGISPAGGGQAVSFDLNNNVFVARAAVNYRFGGPGY
jgi:outer membrane immunogenic protein